MGAQGGVRRGGTPLRRSLTCPRRHGGVVTWPTAAASTSSMASERRARTDRSSASSWSLALDRRPGPGSALVGLPAAMYPCDIITQSKERRSRFQPHRVDRRHVGDEPPVACGRGTLVARRSSRLTRSVRKPHLRADRRRTQRPGADVRLLAGGVAGRNGRRVASGRAVPDGGGALRRPLRRHAPGPSRGRYPPHPRRTRVSRTPPPSTGSSRSRSHRACGSSRPAPFPTPATPRCRSTTRVGGPITSNGVGSALPDYRIAPDEGSVNPVAAAGGTRRPLHGDLP